MSDEIINQGLPPDPSRPVLSSSTGQAKTQMQPQAEAESKKRGRPPGKVAVKSGDGPEVDFVALKIDTSVRPWAHKRGAEIFGVSEFPVFFDAKGVAREVDQENLEHFLDVPGFIGLTADDLGKLV